MRGYPQESDLHYVDTLKRVLIASARFISKIPSIFYSLDKIIQEVTNWMSDIYWADVPVRSGNRFKRETYSKSTREVLRVLLKINSYQDEFEVGKYGWVYYLVAIWETDLAYRFRGQDILALVDKQALIENPRGEILRLVDIALEREIGGVTPKIELVKRLLKFALFSKKIRESITDFLLELDVKEIAMDDSDKYWSANKFDYNYEGKTYQERMDWKVAEDKAWERTILPPEQPRIAIYPPNEAFYKLNEMEALKMAEQAIQALMSNWKAKQPC